MPSAPAVVRATTVFLVCAGGLAACGGTTPTPQARPGAPTTTAVVRSRFAVAVDLDHEGLLITPPAPGTRPAVTQGHAETLFEATDAVQGPYAYAIFGLGVVTVAPRVENATTTTTTTTTAPPPPSTVPPTTLPPTTVPPPPTTTTTAPPPTTTTTTTTVPATTTTTGGTPVTTADRGSPGRRRPRLAILTATAAATSTVPSSSTSATAPTVPVAPSLPTYRRHLAWVGIVWDATSACPGTTTTRPPSLTTTVYEAVIIDARTGHQVLAYQSGGTSACTGDTATPAVTRPDELLSVPWTPVGPASTAVQIDVPPCGHYYGWTQVPTAGGGVADQVVVAVPFDPTCGSTVAQTVPVDQVVPLGAGQGLATHAPVGPVDALQALPDD